MSTFKIQCDLEGKSQKMFDVIFSIKALFAIVKITCNLKLGTCT